MEPDTGEPTGNELMHTRISLAVLWLLAFSLALHPLSDALALEMKAGANKGITDLRAHDFNHYPTVSLTGPWQFHWQAFRTASEINFDTPDGAPDWIELPGKWNNHIGNGKKPGGKGFATIALRVVTGPMDRPMVLSIQEIQTAYTVFINGRLANEVGKTGKTPETSVPEYKPVLIDIPLDSEVIDILIHISNFHHRLGGPWSGVSLGLKSHLTKDASTRLVMSMFMLGSIFIMGLYHLSLYGLRRSYPPTLFFGIFCCLITLRALVTNERYLHLLFPAIPWELLMKAEYLGFYLAVPLFSAFIAVLFPKEFSRTVLITIVAVSILFSALVLFSPARVYSHTVQAYQGFTLLVCAYLFAVLARAGKNRREGVWALVIGFSILFASIFNDVLYANGLIDTAYTVQMGMFSFIFSQAFILALRFSRTYLQVETKTLALTREIKSRKKLEHSLVKSHKQFKNSRIALILGLAKLAEYRDTETGNHLERMREYARILAEDLSQTQMYRDYITPDYIEDIFQSAILHDIGKIGIRDEILLKPGKLTDPEFETMKTHTLIGGDALTAVAEKVGVRSFLTLGKDIAYAHHEKWDGSGYPNKLRQEKIPLSARITAVADVYDALTSERPYKKAFTHETALEIIRKDSGSHFDPGVVAAFLRQADRINRVREKFNMARPLQACR